MAGGTILAIQPVLIPFLAVIFLACLLPTGMVSLGSVTMAALYPEMCIRDSRGTTQIAKDHLSPAAFGALTLRSVRFTFAGSSGVARNDPDRSTLQPVSYTHLCRINASISLP